MTLLRLMIGHKIYEVEKNYSIVVWTIGMKILILKDENNLMGMKHKQRRSTTKDFYITTSIITTSAITKEQKQIEEDVGNGDFDQYIE